MAKIVVTLDTETKQMDMTVNGVNYDIVSVSAYKYTEGFDFRAEQKPVSNDGITNCSYLVAYANEFKTKSAASVKFIDEKHTLAEVTETKLTEKLADWIQSNLK